MRFPGQRNAKHYFPVTRKQRRFDRPPEGRRGGWYLLGLDQVLVDMEVHAPQGFVQQAGLVQGESVSLDEERFVALVQQIKDQGLACRYTPGGTVANTLSNYARLSGESAVLLGAIEECIHPGSPAFNFVARTLREVDLSHLQGVEGSVGTAITFITPDGERSFAVAPGVSVRYGPEQVSAEVVQQAAAVVVSLYALSDPDWPIAAATRRVMALANEAQVPVAFGLGTAGLVRRMRDTVQQLLADHVTVASMNNREAEALTGHDDALLACRDVLQWVDLAIVTEGPRGMTIGGYTDRACRRETSEPVRSKSIPDYNRYEFSRLMRRQDCDQPQAIYTHIHPYHGGPERLANTSGAGDAALAAVLHDVAADEYHRAHVPNSAKHQSGARFLTYSSLSRNAQYGNRVAYEVLRGLSPQLEGPVGPDE